MSILLNPKQLGQTLAENYGKALRFGAWGAGGGAVGSILGESMKLNRNPFSFPSFWQLVIEIGIWFGIVGACISLALLIGHTQYSKKKLQLGKVILTGAIPGALAGFVAGAIAQGLYSAIGPTEVLRVICWGIAGGLLGLGLSFRIPNLGHIKGLLGGAVGGVLGGILFILFASLIADQAGRLMGIAAIGFFIGLMIILVEAALRQAWLVVHWTEKERTTLSLGKRPIVLGSSDEADIYLRKDQGYPLTTAKIFMEGNTIVMQFDESMRELKGMKVLRQELTDGSRKKLGNILLEVKTALPS